MTCPELATVIDALMAAIFFTSCAALILTIGIRIGEWRNRDKTGR